jgi:hypothetical protein
MQYTTIFTIAVGVLMIAQWGISLATKKVPELSTEPRKMGFHLAAEFLTAGVLILAGIALLAQSLIGYPLALLALGMLLYTLVNSPGYFAQNGQWAPVLMFAILLVLSLVSLYELFTNLGRLIRVG